MAGKPSHLAAAPFPLNLSVPTVRGQPKGARRPPPVYQSALPRIPNTVRAGFRRGWRKHSVRAQRPPRHLFWRQTSLERRCPGSLRSQSFSSNFPSLPGIGIAGSWRRIVGDFCASVPKLLRGASHAQEGTTTCSKSAPPERRSAARPRRSLPPCWIPALGTTLRQTEVQQAKSSHAGMGETRGPLGLRPSGCRNTGILCKHKASILLPAPDSCS